MSKVNVGFKKLDLEVKEYPDKTLEEIAEIVNAFNEAQRAGIVEEE